MAEAKPKQDADAEKRIPVSEVCRVMKAAIGSVVTEDRKLTIEMMLSLASAPDRTHGHDFGLTERDMDIAIQAVRAFAVQFALKLATRPVPDLMIAYGTEAEVKAQAQAQMDKGHAATCVLHNEKQKEKGTIH